MCAEGDDSESKLFPSDPETYGKEYRKHLLEQYKLCVTMADNVSSRRSTANNFFLSLNTLLLAIIGILGKLGAALVAFNYFWVIISALAGILFCLCWFACIRSYRDLNEAKFKVINSIERKLPVAAFDMEWAFLVRNKKTLEYPHLTRIERWIPGVFVMLYVMLLVIVPLLILLGP